MARRRDRRRRRGSDLAWLVAIPAAISFFAPVGPALLIGVGILIVAAGSVLVGLLVVRKMRERPAQGHCGADPSPARCIVLDGPGLDSALGVAGSSGAFEECGDAAQRERLPVRRIGGGSTGWAVPADPGGQVAEESSAVACRGLVERLEAIDWFQFEKLMARVFEKQGYEVRRLGGAHADDGIDLVIAKGDDRIAVQCKHWKAWKVNPKTVRELLGAMTAAGIPRGRLLTLRGYTQEARAKAVTYGIDLYDERDIVRLLEETDARYDREMIELLDDTRKFCPRCESEMILRTAKKGSGAGQTFWGCSRFPACDYVLR